MIAHFWPAADTRTRPVRLLTVALLTALTLFLAGSSGTLPVAAQSSGFVAGETVVVTTDLLNVRASPSLGAPVLHVLAHDDVMRVTGGPVAADGYTWYELETWMAGPMAGWAAGEYLATDSSEGDGNALFQVGETVVVDTARLNGRSGPELGCTVDQLLPWGTPALVIDGPIYQDGYQWYQLELQSGDIVWAVGEGLAAAGGSAPGFAVGDIATVATDALNLRSGAGLTAPVLRVLDEGASVTVIGSPLWTDGYTWYPVSVSTGATGWVAGEYLA